MEISTPTYTLLYAVLGMQVFSLARAGNATASTPLEQFSAVAYWTLDRGLTLYSELIFNMLKLMVPGLN